MSPCHNGVLVKNHFSLAGETLYIGKPGYRNTIAPAIKQQVHPRSQLRHQRSKHLWALT